MAAVKYYFALLLCLIAINAFANNCNGPFSDSKEVIQSLIEKSLNSGAGVKYKNLIIDATTSELKLMELTQGNSQVDYHAKFKVNDGIMTFNIKLTEGNTRSQTLRGKQAFDLAINHFGSQLIGIEAIWKYGDNLALLNHWTSPQYQLTPSQAALKTWTGQQAQRHGFQFAYKIESIGSPGRYSYASFLFNKVN